MRKLSVVLLTFALLGLCASAFAETGVRDRNGTIVGMCVNSTDDKTPLMLRCDATTEALEVEVVSSVAPTGIATEVTLAAAAVDLAAIEVTQDALVVDAAAMEVLLGTIDTDTGAMATDLAAIEVTQDALVVDAAAIEVLLGTIDTDTGAMVTDLAAIEVTQDALVVDAAAMEVLLTTIEANTSVAPTAATVGAGAAAQAADFAIAGAVANNRLTMLSLKDTGAGTAAGIVRNNPGAGDCNTGNVIAYFGVLGANAVFNLVTGSRDIDISAGLCVDVTAGTIDAAWSTVVEAAP